jgi:hypothetical protein
MTQIHTQFALSISTAHLVALARFSETCSEGRGYDVSKDTMENLAKIGLVRRVAGRLYEITEVGETVLATQRPAPVFGDLTPEQIADCTPATALILKGEGQAPRVAMTYAETKLFISNILGAVPSPSVPEVISVTTEDSEYRKALQKTIPPMDSAGVSRWWFSLGYRAGMALSLPVQEPVEGDLLPAIGSKVFIHLNSLDKWVEHTVSGYYAWKDLGSSPDLHRVCVRVLDSKGYPNARSLSEIRTEAPASSEA